MQNPDSIFNELSAGRRQPYEPPGKKRKASRPQRQHQPQRTPAATASERSSIVAQRWVDAAEAYGMRLPFNVNWFAHRISDRVVADDRLSKVLRAGNDDKVVRWINKMTDLFWADFVDASDTSANVANVFLDEVWDGLRDYAYDSLRARYLKDNGRTLPTPQYGPQRESEMHQKLESLRVQNWIERNLEAELLPHQRHVLDGSLKRVVLSALEKSHQEREEDA